MSAKITQEQYDRWIKNMSKNKSGTSFIILNLGDGNFKKKKLYQDDMRLYFFDVDDYKKIIYCEIIQQPKWEEQTWTEIIQQQQQEVQESQVLN